MDFKTLGQIEFPGSTVEQEYPPGPMSGYETLIPGHGVFCASATAESNDGTYNSYEAFDGDLRDISAWQPKYPQVEISVPMELLRHRHSLILVVELRL